MKASNWLLWVLPMYTLEVSNLRVGLPSYFVLSIYYVQILFASASNCSISAGPIHRYLTVDILIFRGRNTFILYYYKWNFGAEIFQISNNVVLWSSMSACPTIMSLLQRVWLVDKTISAYLALALGGLSLCNVTIRWMSLARGRTMSSTSKASRCVRSVRTRQH